MEANPDSTALPDGGCNPLRAATILAETRPCDRH